MEARRERRRYCCRRKRPLLTLCFPTEAGRERPAAAQEDARAEKQRREARPPMAVILPSAASAPPRSTFPEEAHLPIHNQSDIAAIEAISLSERALPESSYAALVGAAKRSPDGPACPATSSRRRSQTHGPASAGSSSRQNGQRADLRCASRIACGPRRRPDANSWPGSFAGAETHRRVRDRSQ